MCVCVCVLCSSSGGAGAVDGERRADSGEQGPDLPAAEDPSRTGPNLLHPADLPLHLREQEDGHHHQGMDVVTIHVMVNKTTVSVKSLDTYSFQGFSLFLLFSTL